MSVDAQVQVRQRVLPVGVGAVLGAQHVRTERTHQPGHHGVERPRPGCVTGAGRDRDVHRGAARRAVTAFGGETGAGNRDIGLWWIDTVSTRGSS